MKTEQVKCIHCGRHNWSEHTHCKWCCRAMPTPADTIANWIMGTVSVASLIALGWWVTRL